MSFKRLALLALLMCQILWPLAATELWRPPDSACVHRSAKKVRALLQVPSLNSSGEHLNFFPSNVGSTTAFVDVRHVTGNASVNSSKIQARGPISPGGSLLFVAVASHSRRRHSRKIKNVGHRQLKSKTKQKRTKNVDQEEGDSIFHKPSLFMQEIRIGHSGSESFIVGFLVCLAIACLTFLCVVCVMRGRRAPAQDQHSNDFPAQAPKLDDYPAKDAMFMGPLRSTQTLVLSAQDSKLDEPGS